MGQVHQTSGAAIPFFPYDWHKIDIDPDAFDPITTLHDDDFVHPTEMPEPHMSHQYERKGFLVRPNADGAVYAISKARYDDVIHGLSTWAQKRVALAALDPKEFHGHDGAWIETPIVKVFGTDGDGAGHFVSAATSIEVGIIL